MPDTLNSVSDLKDDVLNRLAPNVNVAQFISFDPGLNQRYAWVHGRPANQLFLTTEDAAAHLLTASPSHRVNIRSFKPGSTKGHELIRDLASVAEIVTALKGRANSGFFTIMNEVIPVDDCGVSGVYTGDVIEFAPGDTPKCVDKPGVACLPRQEGLRLLELVYGFSPFVTGALTERVEFSIHPIRRGFRNEHTIIWESEPAAPVRKVQIGRWPNRFSKLIGDKAYGLLIASILGYPVPLTTVIGRGLAPFTFGNDTGSSEIWLRTCPREPVAGKYPTYFGWQDPYAVMAESDPDGTVLSSILSQRSVNAEWSGAARTTESGIAVEGIAGRGDQFMLAAAQPQDIPAITHRHVIETHESIRQKLHSVKFEWVWDGRTVWIVQLHRRRSKGLAEDIIYPGEANEKVTFNPLSYERNEVLDKLRELVAELRGRNVMVVVTGGVGVTSHVGDILAEARIPSRLEWSEHEAAEQIPFEWSVG